MPEIEPWWSVWAKADRDPQNPAIVGGWLPLHQHLADSAGVAGLLVDEWVSPQVVRRIAADLGGTAADVRVLASWLAAVHDVGKISPAFAVQAHPQAPALLDAMRRVGLAVRLSVADDNDRSDLRHEFVGHDIVWRWLHDEHGFNKRIAAAQLASVVDAHHGVPSTSANLGLVRGRRDLAGAGPWLSARESALRWATDLVGGPQVLGRYTGVALDRPSQALLAAIVIMADWIASNAELFPLDDLRTAHELPRAPDASRPRGA